MFPVYHKTAGKVYYCSDTISTIVTNINRLKGTKEVCESRMNKLIKKYVDSNQNKITYLRFETEKKHKTKYRKPIPPPPQSFLQYQRKTKLYFAC